MAKGILRQHNFRIQLILKMVSQVLGSKTRARSEGRKTERNMFGSLSANLYRPLRMTSSRHRPWQIAAAAATGVGCGALLTESPIGALGLACLFFLPVHLPVAIAATLLTAGLLWSFEPALGQIGGWALDQPSVLGSLRQLHGLPLVPWLRLNNTVVFGGLMFAVLQFIPMFILTRSVVCVLADAFQDTAEWLRVDGAHEHELSANVGYSYDELEAANEIPTFSDAESNSELNYVPAFEGEAPSPVSGETEDESDLPIQFIPIDDESVLEAETEEEFRLNDLPLKDAEDPTEISALLEGEEHDELDGAQSTAVQGSSFEDDIEEWVTEVVDDESVNLRSTTDTSVEATLTSKEQSSDDTDQLEEAAAKVEASLNREPSELGAEGVAKRASELAELVDEMLEVIRGEEVAENEPTQIGSEEVVSTDTAEGEPEPSFGLKGDSKREVLGPGLPLNSDLAASKQLAADSSHMGPHAPHLNDAEAAPPRAATLSAASDSATTKSPELDKRAVTFEEVAQHEEALRYLLHHLKEIKNLSGKVED
ncbi:MAG: hypothetical protein ACE361_10565 [Aureliella sp.]